MTDYTGTTLQDFAVPLDRRPACVGYANCCVCERCTDRADRARVLEGTQNAASEAQRQSADYFARPWRYREDPSGVAPPMPLGD